MSKTVCVTIVKTITLEDDRWLLMSDEDLIQEFEDEYSLDDWCWDDSSHTVEVFNTEDEILGDEINVTLELSHWV